MFSSHQRNDFWDRRIVFSPKRTVRILTICMLVTLFLFTVLWIAPGGRSSRTLAPLQHKAAHSTSHSSTKDNSIQDFHYSSSPSTDSKDASHSSSKSSDLDYSSKSSDPERPPYYQEESVSKEKTKLSQNLACTTGSGKEATFTKTPYPPLPPGDDEEYMSICIAVKNQHLDLLEWFPHYYYHHGIRRFYVMDDGSQPPISILPDYGIPHSAITFTYIPRTPIEERPE